MRTFPWFAPVTFKFSPCARDFGQTDVSLLAASSPLNNGPNLAYSLLWHLIPQHTSQ